MYSAGETYNHIRKYTIKNEQAQYVTVCAASEDEALLIPVDTFIVAAPKATRLSREKV